MLRVVRDGSGKGYQIIEKKACRVLGTNEGGKSKNAGRLIVV
jgi:hypothetical protein